MSNNSAFGTAQPPKRPAGPAPSSADSIKEGSSAPVDPEWEAARYSFALSALCLSEWHVHVRLPQPERHGEQGW